MTTTKTHYSCAELAAMKLTDKPSSERAWLDLVKREGWLFQEVKSKGRVGSRREYQPPAHVAREIAHHLDSAADSAAARRIAATKAALIKDNEVTRHSKTVAALGQVQAQLTLKGLEKFDAKFDILLAWRNWCGELKAERTWMGKKDAEARFVEAYNAGQIPVSDTVRAAVKKLSTRTLERLIKGNAEKGITAGVDKRQVKRAGANTVFAKHPELEKHLIAIITEKPHIKSSDLCKLLNHARVDRESGEALWPVVDYTALCRRRKQFEDGNRPALTAATAPAAFKNKYMTAFGNLAGDVTRLNQRWEMDGTPADWEFVDGRHTASVVIDVWGRRPMIRFSKTPRTETNKQLLRDAILAWGVPEDVDTDNGSDYTSREIEMAFEMLGVNHRLAQPFSPWQKGHVERFIKTYLHSMLELLDNFIGHSVADRKAIEDRRTFAEQLFKKNAVVKVNMTAEEMQHLTNQWLSGCYMQDRHEGLGMSPFEKVASFVGAVRRIENERHLDILLFKPAGRPVVTKKGIRHDNAYFIHADLARLDVIGNPVEIYMDPSDLGRLYVWREGRFLCVAECPERTGIDRAEVAAHARGIQNKEAAEKRREWAKVRRDMPMSTAELVQDLIRHSAEKAGKLTAIQRGEEYRTERLAEAEKAASALDTPAASEDASELKYEAERLLADVLYPKAPVIDLAGHRGQLPPILAREENPIPEMNDEQKFDAWHALDAHVKDGGVFAHDWQARFHRGFSGHQAFGAVKAMRELRGERVEGV